MTRFSAVVTGLLVAAAACGGAAARPALPPPEYEEPRGPETTGDSGADTQRHSAGSDVLHSPRMGAARIDRTLVLHVAELASLSLLDEEVGRFADDLRRIVSYVEQLDALDTSDVPPTAHVQLARVAWRSDEARPGLAREEALRQAPAVEADGFAVPPFVE